MRFRLDLGATPAVIALGASSRLSWDCVGGVGPVQIVIDQGIGLVAGVSGGMLVSPGQTTVYTGVATDIQGNTVTSSITVVVPLPYITFTATPPVKSRCAPSLLAWSVANSPDTVTIDQGIGLVAAAGTLSVSPIVTTTYTLTAVNVAGTQIQSVTVTIADAAHVGGSGTDTVTPDIGSSAVSNFSGGANKPAGLYYVEYVDGAMRESNDGAAHQWSVNGRGAGYAQEVGYHVTDGPNDGTGNNAYTTNPGPFGVPIVGAWGYADQASCEAANAGFATPYCHVGGKPIGVYYFDPVYTDNVAGSPNPTWRLVGPSPMVSLWSPDPVIYAGNAAELDWTSNATSQSIDHGVGALVGTSGTVSVSPVATTLFTLTGVTDGFANATAGQTITVLPVPPPANVAAAALCGGLVALTWDAPPAYTSFIVRRSATPGGPYTTIGTPTLLSFTDTPPTTWDPYYYVVEAVNNGSISAASAEASSHGEDVPAPTTGLAAYPSIGSAVLTWSVAAHAQTYDLWRGFSGGSETLFVAGIAATRYEVALSRGLTYYFKVRAVNSCGQSALSDEIAVSVVPIADEEEIGDPASAYTDVFARNVAFTTEPDPAPSSTDAPDPSTPWS